LVGNTLLLGKTAKAIDLEKKYSYKAPEWAENTNQKSVESVEEKVFLKSKKTNSKSTVPITSIKKLPGLFIARLLSDDLLFFNEDDIGYDGEGHYYKKIEVNADICNEERFEQVMSNLIAVVECFKDLIEYVEKNNRLRIKINNIGEELHPFLRHENMST